MNIRISANKVVWFLFTLVSTIFVGSVCVHAIGLKTGHWRLGGLYALFSLDGEGTFPTWLNSFIILLLFMVTWAISRVNGPKTARYHNRWKFLSVMFLLMSIDEIAMFHEAIGKEISTRFNSVNHLYFGFAIPGIILAVALFIAYIPLLRNLPRKVMLGMMMAGVIYIGGAAGIEMIEAKWFFLYGERHAAYLLLSDLEELCEMGGLVFLLKILLDYLRSLSGGAGAEWRFHLEP